MSTSPSSPSVNPSPYNLAIDALHDAIFSARQELHAIETELEFYAATAMSCLAFLPAGDVPTDAEVARVALLEDAVHELVKSARDIYLTMTKGVTGEFTAAAVEGLTAREKRIGVQRTAPVQFLERYLAEYFEDDSPDEA